MNKKIFFLSGLPRTGSTLLLSILFQNRRIHCEGNSALCQIMWDNHVSLYNNCFEQISASKDDLFVNKFMMELPKIYYKDVEKNYIIDKCRSWTIEENLFNIKEYIDPKPKFLIMTRPINEIIKSFLHIYKNNNMDFGEKTIHKLLKKDSEPIMRSLNGILNIKKQKDIDYLLIQYKDLIENTDDTIKSIYEFLNISFFNHNFENIEDGLFEKDYIYGLNNFHQVRKEISYQKKEIFIPEYIYNQCSYLDQKINA